MIRNRVFHHMKCLQTSMSHVAGSYSHQHCRPQVVSSHAIPSTTLRYFRNVYNSYFYIYEKLENEHKEKIENIKYPKKKDLDDRYIIDELLSRVPVGFDARYLQYFAMYLKNRGQVKHLIYLKERLVLHWNDVQTKIKQSRDGTLPKDDQTTMDIVIAQHPDPSIPFSTYLRFNEVMEIYLLAAIAEACRLGKNHSSDLLDQLNLFQNNPKHYLCGSLGYEFLFLYCTDGRMLDFAANNNAVHDFMDAHKVMDHLIQNEHMNSFISFNLLWLVAFHEKSLVSDRFASIYRKSERSYRLFYYIIVTLKEQTKKVPNRTIYPLSPMVIQRMEDELFEQCENVYGINRSDLKGYFDLKPREGQFWQSMKDEVLN